MAKVLVIEDDASCLEIIEDALELENHDIHIANNGYEGLALLELHQDADLILLDRMMPKMDGMTFLKEANEKNLIGDIPVILQTAAGSEEQVIEGANKKGVYYYLTKPYDYKTLLAIVRSALS